MPNHKPHTYSHEKVRLMVETYEHCKNRLLSNDEPYHHQVELLDDIDRCIKILESEDD